MMYFSICASEHASNIHFCGSEKHQERAFVTRPSCSQTATCSTSGNSRPPYFLGTSMALKPRSIARALFRLVISGGQHSLVHFRFYFMWLQVFVSIRSCALLPFNGAIAQLYLQLKGLALLDSDRGTLRAGNCRSISSQCRG